MTHAVILCGGQSSRMGTPKHLMDTGGGPVWRQMAEALAAVFDRVYISCRESQRGDFKNHEVIVDVFDAIGPMGGMVSAMRALCAESLFFIGCDLPFFEARMAREIIAANDQNVLATCARKQSSPLPEPLVAVWNSPALPLMEAAITQGDYSLMKLLKTHGCKTVAFEDALLQNVNTPEDLAKAQSAGRWPRPR